MDYKTYRCIVEDYFDFISSEVLDKSREVRLPARMGVIYVEKLKPFSYTRKQLQVDFKATKDLNQTVLHFNEHTNGYRFRFHWNKRDILTRFSRAYEMIFTRTNKRRLAYLIKNDGKDYIEK